MALPCSPAPIPSAGRARQHRQRRRVLACLPVLSTAAFAGLSGCAALRRPPAARTWTGRLSLQIGATPTEPARAVTAGFELWGDGDTGELRLTGPLGATLGVARWSPGRYELDDGRQVTRLASLAALAEAGIGEALPLAALFAWLTGRPWPGAPHQPAADGGSGFEQLGWRIDPSALDQGRLAARRDGEPSLVLRIRLDTQTP